MMTGPTTEHPTGYDLADSRIGVDLELTIPKKSMLTIKTETGDVTVSGISADYQYYGTGDRGGAPSEGSVRFMEKSLTNSAAHSRASGIFPASRKARAFAKAWLSAERSAADSFADRASRAGRWWMRRGAFLLVRSVRALLRFRQRREDRRGRAGPAGCNRSRRCCRNNRMRRLCLPFRVGIRRRRA